MTKWSKETKRLLKKSGKLIAKSQARGDIPYDVIYCPVADRIGILDYNFFDKSLTGFWVNKVFRVTAFPEFLGEL